MQAIVIRFCGHLIPVALASSMLGTPAVAQEPKSCADAVALERVDKQHLPAVQQLCIDYLMSASPEDRRKMLGLFLVNDNQNNARFIKAVELDPMLPEMDSLTLIRANAYRAKERNHPQIALSIDDIEGFIEDAKRVDDEVALTALYYSATVERADTDMNLKAMGRYLTSGLAVVESNNLGARYQLLYTNGLGNVALEDGRLVDALNFYFDAIGLADTLEPSNKIVGNINIGRVFGRLGAHEEALKYYNVSQQLLDTEGPDASPNHQVNLFIYKGDALSELGQFAAADGAFIDASRLINDKAETPLGRRLKTFRQRLYAKHAETAVALGDLERAVALAEASAAIEDEQQSAFIRADVKSWLASVYAGRGNVQAARQAMIDAEQSMMSEGRTWADLKSLEDERIYVFEYVKNMAKAASSLGISDMAARYAGLSAELSEMLIAQRDLAAVANAGSLLEIRSGRERLAALADLNAQQDAALRLSRISQWLAFALAAMAAIIAFLAYRFYRTQRALAQTRALFVKDTHHRAKNHLQVVTSLLNISLQRIKDADGEIDSFREIRDQTKAMAVLHDHLQELPPEKTTSIRADEYFANLADSLEDAYNAPCRIDTSGIDPLGIDVNQITPICLITTEVIANSFKHLDHPSVTISLTRADQTRARRAILTISDDGDGFSQKDIEQSRSIGMEIIHDLAEQVGGILELETGPAGTVWTLQFPLIEMADELTRKG